MRVLVCPYVKRVKVKGNERKQMERVNGRGVRERKREREKNWRQRKGDRGGANTTSERGKRQRLN